MNDALESINAGFSANQSIQGVSVMIRIVIVAVAVLGLFVASDAAARDTLSQYSIQNVLNNPEFAPRLAGVSFYFGTQEHPEAILTFGEDKTSKKTNAFNKTDQEACDWAMLSALLQLRTRAISLGANAVVNIQSNYKDNLVSSETEYTCGAGAIMAGVALTASFIKIEEASEAE
jgi:hypothetical protein